MGFRGASGSVTTNATERCRRRFAGSAAAAGRRPPKGFRQALEEGYIGRQDDSPTRPSQRTLNSRDPTGSGSVSRR